YQLNPVRSWIALITYCTQYTRRDKYSIVSLHIDPSIVVSLVTIVPSTTSPKPSIFMPDSSGLQEEEEEEEMCLHRNTPEEEPNG
ncbi:unnamed protein product, partial [Brassica rapa subsp. narinosa]